jgi:predicted GNAT family acetyltransferase
MGNLFDYRDVVASDVATVTTHRFDETVDCAAEREAWAAWVSRRIATGVYIGRFALLEGAVVAGAGVVMLDWGPTRDNVSGVCGRIVAVYTQPALRCRGLASALVRQVMDRAVQHGVRDFRLAASVAGSGVYRQLGFRPYDAEMIFKVGE